MAKQPQKKMKHVPQRTCIGCQTVLPKKALIRVVRTAEGVKVDLTGKAPGRGAYIHGQRSCWEKALKGSLARALKTELNDEDRQALQSFILTLPPETGSPLESQEVKGDKGTMRNSA